MSVEKQGRCGRCEQHTDVRVASRKRGGTYNRAPRFYDTNICEPCARILLERAHSGQRTTEQWSISSLRRAWALGALGQSGDLSGYQRGRS